MRALPFLLALPLLAQPPRFTVRDAIQAEWMRQPPTFTDAQKASLPPADRARLELTLARIGAAGAPALLPPELDHPTPEAWEAKAAAARTPRERFDALFFLNRSKRPDALKALDGLTPADAATWPAHLHLESQIATARLNGGEVSPALQSFLDALQKAGKVDPVRAQAAQLRLVMAGKEKALLPAIPATPGSVLAMMDAANSGAWKFRAEAYKNLAELSYREGGEDWWSPLGLMAPSPKTLIRAVIGVSQRNWQGLPSPASSEFFNHYELELESQENPSFFWRTCILPFLGKFTSIDAKDISLELASKEFDPLFLGILLPTLREHGYPEADRLRAQLLVSSSPIARAAAIDDLPAAPADLDALTRRCWGDTQFEAQQTLIQSYAKWKLPVEAQKAELRRWLTHPNWSCRYEAYQVLVKLDPTTPWPASPKPTAADTAILREATRLAERRKSVRLRITFSGHRSVTLKLDPTVAPMNVANLVLLARKRYFDGHHVPRVVPDFVVQMGSPYDTMDGGPGYTVRCEDSPTWYGPGSVGMALAGKDTGGSQFFITTNATPHLTGKYTWMGQVEDPDHDLKVLDDLELGAKIVSIRVLGDPSRR